MPIDPNLTTVGATIGGGFFVGVLMGYAVKKIAKLAAIVVGLFFVGITYLQLQGILGPTNWDKVNTKGQAAISTLANATTQMTNNLSNATGNDHATQHFLSGLGIPLTGAVAMGFAIGFMKG